MSISPHNGEYKEDFRRLAGLIARLPDAEPPSGLSEAVMRRLKPKRVGWRRGWLRYLQSIWWSPALRAAAAGAALALIAGIVALAHWQPGFLHNRGAAQDASPTAVTFFLNWPGARKVALVGSFNHWNPQGYQMHRDTPDAPWELVIELSKGSYHYAFIVDDQQMVPDPNALWSVDDGYGNLNSALIVEGDKQNAIKG
ncbi:MAG: hypothetical protein M0036_03825 [Desulfobacteraceae bacterium]|nr:hypothetical protein [Desulfobacteraceae bacterium]